MLAEKALGHGEVKDDYTGKAIPANKSDVDHVVSKNEFHYAEGGFMLDEARRKAFANDRDNLAVTDRSVNRSKGSESIPDAKERRPEIDRRRTRHTEERAGEAVSRHRPSAAQAARYYGKKVAPEAATSGLRLGMRQALGLCLHELTIGIFDEVTDICRNGLRADETSYAHAVEKRVAEIWRRVREKWRDMLSAFRDGFIAGALSEVVTLLVNLFYTTSKRVVRIIREGALSFLRALKMIFVLPDGMTRAEALDAATKVQANRRREFLFAELDARVEEALGAAESASGGGVSVIL